MRGLGILGLVATAFGVASHQVLAEWNVYNTVNVAVGGVLLAIAIVAGTMRLMRRTTAPDAGPTLDALLMAVSVAWGAVLVELALAYWGVRFDWTFEQRFLLAPATRTVISELADEGPVDLTLYVAQGDPRQRGTRLLLEQIARAAGRGKPVTTGVRDLDASPEEEDHYGIGSSNSVVILHGGNWELVERPTEGALYEALEKLLHPANRKLLYVAAGAGEGDFERSDDAGFSGLRAALETEGYALRPWPTAVAPDVPADADGVLVIAPERRLTAEALAGLRRYLDARGGRLVAFLEPGRTTGVEEILAEFGLTSPDAIVIDPDSGPAEGDAPGLNPLAHGYAQHPVTRGLDHNRMTFFRHARSFTLHKPRPDDRLTAIVFSSGDAWLDRDTSHLNRKRTPERPPDAQIEYWPLVVAGQYERDGQQVRIVAFGDATFATNRYLRTLFNLDLTLNAVHWALEREPAITLRPKLGHLLQFPVPIQRSLDALYGVGLLVPELLVMAGAWVWIRRRGA